MAVLDKPQGAPGLGAAALSPGADARAAVLGVFAAAVHHAVSFAGRMQSSQALALREFETALRRAQTVVRLAAPVLSKRAARRIDSTLSAAYRATAAVREADVLSGLITTLDAGDAQLQLEQLRAELMAWRLSRYDDRKLAARLLTGIVNVRSLPEQLDEALDNDTSWTDVVDGLRLTFESCAVHHSRARAVADPTHVTRLHESCRDLTSQLGLFGLPTAADERLGAKRVLRPLAGAEHLRSLHAHAQRLLGPVNAAVLCDELDAMAARKTAKALRRADKFFTRPSTELVRALSAEHARPAAD